MPDRSAHDSSRLIVVLGIMKRSGTNYLYDLLRAHRDCAASPVPEDHLLAHADLLDKYVSTVHGHWNRSWGLRREPLFQALGDGLAGFLQQHTPHGCRTVCKTPSVDNLHLFDQLFPEARLLIILRDGRAVVESGLKTFDDWDFDTAAARWASAASTIHCFHRARGEGNGKHLIVRYEDLYANREAELLRICSFLALDNTSIDFAAIRDLPVRGSSVLRGNAARVHWLPVPRTPDFKPLERFHHWTPAQHARFNEIAGDALRLFGYEPVSAVRAA